MASTTWLELGGTSTTWLEVGGTSTTWLGCISLSCTVCTRGVWRGRTSRMRGLVWWLWRLGMVEMTVILGTLVRLDTAGEEDTRVSEVHTVESSVGGDGDTVEVDTTAEEGEES